MKPKMIDLYGVRYRIRSKPVEYHSRTRRRNYYLQQLVGYTNGRESWRTVRRARDPQILEIAFISMLAEQQYQFNKPRDTTVDGVTIIWADYDA